MAGRIRTLKPDILENKRTASLKHDTWRLFVSAITLADDHGNFVAEHEKLRGSVFWGEAPTRRIGDLIAELVAADLIRTYTARECQFAHIKGWNEHQKIDKPGLPRFPLPPESEAPQSEVITEALVHNRDDSRTFAKVRGGLDQEREREREGKGSEDPASADAGDFGLKLVESEPAFNLEAAYTLYPRKIGRKVGLRRANALIRTRNQFDQFVTAVKNYAECVKGTDPRFIKHFDTFVGCWEDYLDPSTAIPIARAGPSIAVGHAKPSTNLPDETRDCTDEL